MEVAGACKQLVEAATALTAAIGESDLSGADLTELTALIDVTQRVTNMTAGVQAIAVAHVAAIEEVIDDHGVISEQHRGLGHISLDAAGVVAPILGLSAQAASSRVESTVHQCMVAPTLVTAMLAGDVDQWRARVAVSEASSVLSLGEGEVRDPDLVGRVRRVFDDLADFYARKGGWCESAGPLRSRVRRLVTKAVPERVVSEVERAQAERSVRRWAVTLGADRWQADLPAEQSVPMWQAVDARARVLQRSNPILSADQARADALVDLVLHDVSTTVHLHAAVAESAFGGGEVSSARGEAAGLVELGGLAAHRDSLVDVARLAQVPGVSLVRSSAVRCDPGTGAAVSAAMPESSVRSRSKDAARAASAYVVPADMVRLVRLRDGRCRFPNCAVPASRTDQDHVIAWPVGATDPLNLICLCRRHHRVKQRHRWRVRLEPDGTVQWTDPTGRLMTTYPVNHLEMTWLPGGSRSARDDVLPRSGVPAAHAPEPDISPTTVVEAHLKRWCDLADLPRMLGLDRSVVRVDCHVPATLVPVGALIAPPDSDAGNPPPF